MKGLIIGIFLLCNLNYSSQLVINNLGYTPYQLVTQILISDPTISISNVTFTGNANQIGFFNSVNANVGIDSGIILSTGNVDSNVGPNNSPSSSDIFSTSFVDQDLDDLAGNNGFDIAYLEFDFITQGNKIEFNYVFGSEEYLEFVDAGVNDAFGFFLSGPGIAGTFTNNANNLAVIPNTSTYITIDNVNDLVNSTYYINNGDGLSAPQNSDITKIQMDGLTTKLSATSTVICGEKYHIKIAIADMGDEVWNSSVFIESGSFNSTATNIFYPYILPNIFTPNNDSDNDFFTPTNGSYLPSRLEFEVYNRWGKVVYTTTDPNLKWDGVSKDGNALSDGVYYYIGKMFFDACGGESTEKTVKGSVQIIR